MEANPELRELVARALAEDVGPGDVTTEAVVPGGAMARARLIQKAPGVLFGLAAAAEAFSQAGADGIEPSAADGDRRETVPSEVATITGPAHAILAAERVALNFVGHLSGIATLTARFAEAARPGGAVILDTRKTTPGLRALEKAAVAAGGGGNHRFGLHDAVLIKENHAVLAGGVAEAIERAREASPGVPIEVEVRDAGEVEAALGAGADRLLLDNMELANLRAAVAARDAATSTGAGRAELEASGGVSLDTVAAISETGVDYISVGAITHSAPALDVSLLVEPAT